MNASTRGTGRTFTFCHISKYPTGVTGATGFSACMIDKTENSTAGSLLNSVLFVPYRVISMDEFYVDIV